MNTFEKIETAISNATINGNFNSDLIVDKDLRKLAIQTYINKTANENPASVLRDYMDVVDVSILEKKTPTTINLGGNTALVIEKSNTHILGKFNHPTFSDKPYFTIFYMVDPENGEYNFTMGSYDMSLLDATNDFIRRNQ
tara:strand:+ start:178 stop:597 length:420 start_codon:yes stop_codon:yes gene_type:complete